MSGISHKEHSVNADFAKLLAEANSGDIDAQHQLGHSFMGGFFGLKVDDVEAEKWFRLALAKIRKTISLLSQNMGSSYYVDLQDKQSMFMYSLAYCLAQSSQTSEADALLEELFKIDYPPAYYYVGIERFQNSLDEDRKQSGLRLLEKASSLGHMYAKTYLIRVEINKTKNIFHKWRLWKELIKTSKEKEQMRKDELNSMTHDKRLLY